MYYYTKEQHIWLKENRPLYGAKELTKLFNKTFGTSKSVFAIEKKCSRDGRLRKYDTYTQKELNWLQRNRDLYSDCELAELFNKTFNKSKDAYTINRACARHGIKKTVIKKARRGLGYSQDQVDWLRCNRDNHTLNSLTSLFNKTFNDNRSIYSITSCCRTHGIEKKIIKENRRYRI